jgi:signal transduction histidine kinase
MSEDLQTMRPLRMILIDDDEVERSAVRRALEQDTDVYEVEEYVSGEAGLERMLAVLDGNLVDCVLLDDSLPGVSGLEVLDRLREAGVELPVIMLTSTGDEGIVSELLRRGAYDYLPKARLDAEILGSKIRGAWRLFGARRRTRKAEEEREESVVELRRIVVARDKVLKVMSHDLRGPLNNIELAMGILEVGAPEQQRTLAISSVRRAVARADRLINDLLDVAQLSGGVLEMVKSKVDPGSVVKTAVSEVGPAREQRQVEIEVEIEADLQPIHADRGRIHQVLANLLRNAIQCGPRGGLVRVEARGREGCVEFSVKDQGPGLDEEAQAKVFDRFWCAEERKTSAGSGLGLAIAKGLVANHGGTIGVECLPGQGSRFFFTIPLWSGDVEETSADTD